MAVKKVLVRCTHCGHTWRVARPKKNETCPKCHKTGIVPLIP